MLALLITLLAVAFSTYARLATLEQAMRDSDIRQQMMEQTLGRIETRLMVLR
jgi:hypothetical protein